MKNYLDEIISIMETYPRYIHYGGPIVDDVIIAAERHLNVVFPKSYRQFIRKYGYASFHGITIYGISPSSTKNHVIGSLISNNDEMRKIEHIPSGILLIMNEDEYNIIIDTNRMSDEDAPVYEIELGFGYNTNDMVPISSTFAEYFWKRIQDEIAYMKEIGKWKV